jgi:hypothetical protein
MVGLREATQAIDKLLNPSGLPAEAAALADLFGLDDDMDASDGLGSNNVHTIGEVLHSPAFAAGMPAGIADAVFAQLSRIGALDLAQMLLRVQRLPRAEHHYRSGAWRLCHRRRQLLCRPRTDEW